MHRNRLPRSSRVGSCAAGLRATHHFIFICSIDSAEAGTRLAAFVEPLVFGAAAIFFEAAVLAAVPGATTRMMFIMPPSSWPRMWQ